MTRRNLAACVVFISGPQPLPPIWLPQEMLLPFLMSQLCLQFGDFSVETDTAVRVSALQSTVQQRARDRPRTVNIATLQTLCGMLLVTGGAAITVVRTPTRPGRAGRTAHSDATAAGCGGPTCKKVPDLCEVRGLTSGV
jgi:hypothetical protein